MRDINLIPRSRFVVSNLFKSLGTLSIVVLFLLIVAFFGVIDPIQRRRAAERALEKHNVLMLEYAGVREENATLTARLQELDVRHASLSLLFAERLEVRTIMEMIDAAVPERVYLENIEYGDGTVSFRGNAPSLISVANFSIGLTQTELFNQVRIQTIMRDPLGEINSFTVRSVLNPEQEFNTELTE